MKSLFIILVSSLLSQSAYCQQNIDPNQIDYIVDFPDEEPHFVGGQAEMNMYIRANLQYPEDAIYSSTTGKVIVTFIIEKDGSMSCIRIQQPVFPSLDKEALRLVRSMPKWTPGKVEGRPVKTSGAVAIEFLLN